MCNNWIKKKKKKEIKKRYWILPNGKEKLEVILGIDMVKF